MIKGNFLTSGNMYLILVESRYASCYSTFRPYNSCDLI